METAMNYLPSNQAQNGGKQKIMWICEKLKLFLDEKRTDDFHHNTEEVSTYCRVIYVVLVRPKVNDEEVVPKYASSLSITII